MTGLIFRFWFQDGRGAGLSVAERQTIPAEAGATYTVVDAATQAPPAGLRLKRDGDDLELELEDETVVRIENFFAEELDTAFELSEGMTVASADLASLESITAGVSTASAGELIGPA